MHHPKPKTVEVDDFGATADNFEQVEDGLRRRKRPAPFSDELSFHETIRRIAS